VWAYASKVSFVRDNLVAVAMLLATETMWAGWFALLVLAIRRDVSLVYIVIFSAIGAPLIRGLVMEAGGVLNFFFGHEAEEPLYHFSAIEPLVMIWQCMGGVGFVSFWAHLVWLLIKELRG